MKKNFVFVALTAIILFLSTSAFAEKKVRWRIALSWPSHLTPLSSPAIQLAKIIKKISSSKFIIKVEGSEKTKAPLGVLDLVKNNIYQMGHSASFYWVGKNPNTVWFSSIPWGMTDRESRAWFYYGNGMKYMKKVYDKFNVYSFPGGNTGVQMGGWFKKEITSVKDLKGLKMRIPGFAGKVMAEIGVNVVNIPGGELYTALDRGTIDALEWVGPGLDIKMGFHKVAPFYYSGWHEPSGETQFLINKAAFNKLSNKYQTMLVTAMKAVSEDMSIENFAENISAWEKITNDNRNIQIKVFPKPVLREMKRATDRVMQRYADKNELFKEIWNDYSSYMIKARKWTTMGVGNYLKSAEEVGAGVER